MSSVEEVASEIPRALVLEWASVVTSAELAEGGMNSITVALETTAGRVFAKWVACEDASALVTGAETARWMSERGLRAGRPIPATDGRLSVSVLGGELVLLEDVAGTPLSRTNADLWDWGRTLGAMHSFETWQQTGEFMPWLREAGTETTREGWVRKAVLEVLAEYDVLPPLTWARLHSDPAPEAFIRDSSGDVGIIDWAGSIPGPVLYDLASAAMYSGNERNASRVADAYRSTGVISEQELDTYLPTFRRIRAAVQAAYFSKRIADQNLTGISSQEDNEGGLRDARALLTESGVSLLAQNE